MTTSEVTLIVEGTGPEVEARLIASAIGAFGAVVQARVNGVPLDVGRLEEPAPPPAVKEPKRASAKG